jgi:hypothetical protein
MSMRFPPHEREQFRALTRAFLARFFENEITSGTDDLKTSFFWLLSFLAVPGLFMPMTMALSWQLVAMMKGPEALRVLTRGDKAFYLGFVMIATASITAIAWNSLLADRRDGLVLGVLPVRPLVIVAARLGALSLYVTLVGVAMNALASLSFGLFLASGSTFAFAVRGATAHFIASVGASTCVFLCVAGIQGVALAAVGPRIFSRLAPLMQLALVGLVVAGLLMLPAIDVSVVDTLAHRGHEVRPWILSTPPLWFLGLYEIVLGTNDPLFHDLATRAMLATAAGLIATVCSYPLAYRRVMIAVVQEGSAAGLTSRLRSAARVLTLATGRASDIRAVSQFLLATLGRVERHRFIIAASIGVTIAWVMPGWMAMASSRPDVPRISLLSLSFSSMVFLIGGVAIAASMPADDRSGWMFDLTPPGRAPARAALVRTMFLFGVVSVLIVFLPLYAVLWGRTFAITHAMVLIVMGVFVIQLALRRWDGMPCTRPWDLQGLKLDRLWGAYVVGFIIYTTKLPALELALYGHAIATGVFLGIVVGASVVLRIRSLRRSQHDVDVSAFAPGDVLSLN